VVRITLVKDANYGSRFKSVQLPEQTLRIR
jgi:hypothetical protein